jgi:hypothetical protein
MNVLVPFHLAFSEEFLKVYLGKHVFKTTFWNLKLEDYCQQLIRPLRDSEVDGQ